jgi:hypothetical protein
MRICPVTAVVSSSFVLVRFTRWDYRPNTISFFVFSKFARCEEGEGESENMGYMLWQMKDAICSIFGNTGYCAYYHAMLFPSSSSFLDGERRVQQGTKTNKEHAEKP